jgi:hypothetical protein
LEGDLLEEDSPNKDCIVETQVNPYTEEPTFFVKWDPRSIDSQPFDWTSEEEQEEDKVNEIKFTTDSEEEEEEEENSTEEQGKSQTTWFYNIHLDLWVKYPYREVKSLSNYISSLNYCFKPITDTSPRPPGYHPSYFEYIHQLDAFKQTKDFRSFTGFFYNLDNYYKHLYEWAAFKSYMRRIEAKENKEKEKKRLEQNKRTYSAAFGEKKH